MAPAVLKDVTHPTPTLIYLIVNELEYLLYGYQIDWIFERNRKNIEQSWPVLRVFLIDLILIQKLDNL